MQKIRLGPNGPQIAPLGIGCWAWGDRFYWNYGSGYTQDDTQAAFAASQEAGISLFDTAEIYGMGNSERLLGAFIAGSKTPALVASKCFPYPWRLSGRRLLPALRHSLERLGLQSIQLYQMHWNTPLVAIERWMDAMAEAVEAGLIQQVGVSNYNAEQTHRAYESLQTRGIQLASNQVSYSLLQRKIERNGLLELCSELGVTVIAYSPIAQGLLTGKYTPENPPPASRRVSGARLKAIQPLLGEMARIGAKHGGKSAVQVALNWCMAKGTLPIPGAKTARQAQENAGALGWELTEAEVATLDGLTAES